MEIKPEFDWFLTSPADYLLPDSTDGFPLELAKFFLSQYTAPGMPVFDPFLGDGTTMIAADAVGLISFGIELNSERVSRTKSKVMNSQNIFCADARDFDYQSLPLLGTIFTSPPFKGLFTNKTADGELSLSELKAIIDCSINRLAPNGKLIIELIDVSTAQGLPLIGEVSKILESNMRFEKSFALCETGGKPIAEKVFFSVVQVWSLRAEAN